MKRQDLFQILSAVAVGVFVIWIRFRIQILFFYYHFRYLVAFLISVATLFIFTKVIDLIKKSREPNVLEKQTLAPSATDDSVYMGQTDRSQPVHFKESFRRMHIQIVGTTNAGKTESVIVPLAVDDMKKGRGLIIIDGKSDRSLLNKLYAYAKTFGREKDIRVLSICSPEISNTFNPLANGSPLEVTERIFKALQFENEYYKNLQYETLLQTLLIFESAKMKPTPLKVVAALRSFAKLQNLATTGANSGQIEWVTEQMALSRDVREQRTSGLITQLQIMAIGDTAPVFNAEDSEIDIEKALTENHIVYCQLPVLKVPTLGKTVGKLILQCLQGAASSRHLGKTETSRFFSCYLDDFTEYLTEGFVSLLNKSRSANMGIVFAHQALGDLATLGDSVKNTILTNSNLKIFMRTNEPESAEYFAEAIGTCQSTKLTERQTSSVFGSVKTGEASVRSTEEFKFHPNLFKQSLGVGEAVVILPHERGSLPVRMKFRKLADLNAQQLPYVVKAEPEHLPNAPDKTDQKPKPPANEDSPDGQKKMGHRIHEAADGRPGVGIAPSKEAA